MEHFDDQESKGKRNVEQEGQLRKQKGTKEGRKGNKGRRNDKSSMKLMEFRIGFTIKLT